MKRSNVLRLVAAACGLAALFVVARSPSWGKPAGPDKKALATARAEAAQQAFDAANASFSAGSGELDAVYAWSVRLLDGQRDAGVKLPQAFADHVARMEALERAVAARVDSGQAPAAAKLAATYYVTEAAYWAARKKR